MSERLIQDAEIIADFLKVSQSHRVLVICPYHIWDALNVHFIQEFVDTPFKRVHARIIRNKFAEQNFIKFITKNQLKGEKLTENVLVVVSYFEHTTDGKFRTYELIEQITKNTKAKTLLGSY